MRQQRTRVSTGRSKRIIIISAVTVITLALAAAVVFVFLTDFKLFSRDYVPHPHAKNTVVGVPEPEEHMNFSVTDADGRFEFGTVGTVFRQHDGSVKLYLTNFESNDAYLMCEIVDVANETVLYRSGLVRPGEYLQSIEPLVEIKNEATPIHIHVYALGLEDYVSVGAVTLENVLQPNFS
jgi:hypothetical protein